MTVVLVAAALLSSPLTNEPQDVGDRLLARGLTNLGAYAMLHELCTTIGGRLSGSPEAARAVDWTAEQMREIGLGNIRKQPCEDGTRSNSVSHDRLAGRRDHVLIA